MTAPTLPTATTIATEALKRFLNGGPPESADITRAVNYGLEKVKRDIMAIGRTWRPLLRTAYDVTVSGISHYGNPADFEQMYSMGLMSGTHSGVLSAVESASSVTLAADEDATQVECVGKWLLITSGTGTDQAQQIHEYTFATKVATMAEAYATEPVAGDSYLLANNIKNMRWIPNSLYDKFDYPGTPGMPAKYTIIENQGVGQVALYPVPNAVFGLRKRYYADLRKMDITLPLYTTTIMRRWAGLFEQGIYVWKLGEDDDRYEGESQIYAGMLANTALNDLDGYSPPKQEKKNGIQG